MKTYFLLQVEGGFCFEDEHKAANEFFYSKQRGVAILMEMLIDREISVDNVLSLIEDIMALPHLPIVDREPAVMDWLVEDKEELCHIECLRCFLALVKKLGGLSGPKIFLCPLCERHAYIIGLHIFETFYSQEEGREIIELLRDDDLIELADEFNLLKQLEAINLPETAPRVHNPAKEN